MTILSSILGMSGAEPSKPPYEVAAIYQELRSRVLKLRPADIGEKDESKILAVVMDTGFPEAAFTLIATADGSASLYFSNGGGIIGAGAQPKGAAAAKALLSDAAKFVGKMTSTKETPVVMPGTTTFYVVTGKGIVTVSAKDDDFGENRHAVSPLFHKAHELISAIREIDEKRSKGA
ncbi:MAG TPA: hypothetical protein PLX89_23200 [Verrucomicrobiota bacterium]|nr:hypothetical protein [Verrucomicrobiota bacterium]